MARQQLPRLVRQHWGFLPAESRTQMIYPDIALSCCGAAYGTQDSTLVVDLPGSRELPRCYFIPDGRDDPYGKAKFETGSARHLKALHMQPFWARAQRSCDALGLSGLSPAGLGKEGGDAVQSHFVLRRPDEMWLDGDHFKLPEGTIEKPVHRLAVSGHLVLRYGKSAVGVVVPWVRRRGKESPGVDFIDDRNNSNCLRLSIDHGSRADFETGDANSPVATAAIWVRVGSELDDAEFDAWQKQFDATSVSVKEKLGKRIEIELSGKDGALSIAADAPWDASAKVHLVPQPYQGVLEIDGREVGRPLLTAVEPLCSFPPNDGPLGCVAVPAGKPVYWEAESGTDSARHGSGRRRGRDRAPLRRPGTF